MCTHAPFHPLAQVLVPYGLEAVTHRVQTIGPLLTFEDAVAAARSWALEHIPAIYMFPQEDLVITLLEGPEFGKVP